MAAAFDLGMMLGNGLTSSTVQQIPVQQLIPYHNHMFALYEGEQLEDMVESVRQNGILNPLIVQPCEGGKYEILIGHNRWNAAGLAGLETVPAIVKQGLTPEEQEMYVIESNVMQRGFGNLKLSEQAAVVAVRQDKMFSQGKRNDIVQELRQMEHPELAGEEVSGKSGQKSRDKVGEEYGLSGKTVSRLIRIHKLNSDLKELIDSGRLALLAGVELSYLDSTSQAHAANLCGEYKLDVKQAAAIRSLADAAGSVPLHQMLDVLAEKNSGQPKPKTVRIPQETFTRYFPKGTKPEEVSETIEKALELYFRQEV